MLKKYTFYNQSENGVWGTVAWVVVQQGAVAWRRVQQEVLALLGVPQE
jgi:hypothetical protein